MFHGVGEPVDRAEPGTGHPEAGGAGAEDADAGDEGEDQGEVVEGVVHLAERARHGDRERQLGVPSNG